MEIKQGPFSLYDFLGYFIPGAVSIYVLAYAFAYLGMDTGLTELTALTKASELLPFFLAAYVAGHLIALLSSFTIERYFIWHFDYPSKTLLRFDARDFFTKSLSIKNIVKASVALILFPVTIFTTFVCFFSIGRPGLISPLDPLLTTIISRKITRLLVQQGQIDNPNEYDGPITSDFFRVVYHYTIENAPNHVVKMQNYVALFGFNRAMCFLFVVVFWVSIVSFIIEPKELAFHAVLVSLLLANCFFFGFAKFYRRFSLESLMALTVTYRFPDDLAEIDYSRLPVTHRPDVGDPPRAHSHFDVLLNNLRSKMRKRRQRHRP